MKQHLHVLNVRFLGVKRTSGPAPLQTSVLALRWRYPYLMGPPPALSFDASSQQIYVAVVLGGRLSFYVVPHG